MNITTGPELAAFVNAHGLKPGHLKGYFQLSAGSVSNILNGRQWVGEIPEKYHGLVAELVAKYNGAETAHASPVAAPTVVEPTEGEGEAPKRPRRKRSTAGARSASSPATVEVDADVTVEVEVDADVTVEVEVEPLTSEEILDAAMEAMGGFDGDFTNGEDDSQGTADPSIEDDLDDWVTGLTEPPSPTDLSAVVSDLAACEDATEEHVAYLAARLADRFYADEARAERRERRARLTRMFRADRRPTKAEREDPDESDRPDPNALPTEEERAAIREELWPRVQELAMRPDVLSEAMRMVHALGVVGERNIIEFVYLAGTTRVLDRPINPLVYGPSSAGKSYSTNQTMRLFPLDAIINMDTASPASLIYSGRTMRHCILVLAEATQLQGDPNSFLAYGIRCLLSEGRFRHSTVETDPVSGSKEGVDIVREGPVCLAITTTAAELHPEIETRMTRIAAHITADQTKAVMSNVGKKFSKMGSSDHTESIELWREYQQWIGAGPRRVQVPYGDDLGDKIPPVAVRLRRDISVLFGLISAHALLHQAQRDRNEAGEVVATLADYAAVRDIAETVLGEGFGNKSSELEIQILHHVAGKLATAAAEPVQRSRLGKRSHNVARGEVASGRLETSSRQLGEVMGVGKDATAAAVNRLIAGGYLVNNQTVKGKPMLLSLGMRDANTVVLRVLPNPDELSFTV